MYSQLHDMTQCVLPRALHEAGRAKPDDIWLRCSDGGTLTFGQALADAEQVAGHLHALGIRPGDHVVVMMPNGLDFVRAWTGIGRLGAVAVLLNTELGGVFLEHQLNNSQAKLAIVGAQQLPTMLQVCAQTPELVSILVADDAPITSEHLSDKPQALEMTPWRAWQQAQPYTGEFPDYRHIASIMYTSGTSGPSKGVLMTHAHCAMYGVCSIEALDIRKDDVYYITLPLFHANGLLLQLGLTILAQIPAYLRVRFSAAEWIHDIHTHGITVTNMLGATSAFVMTQPESALDRQHALRLIFVAPLPPEHEKVFKERFGVIDVLSGFAMTEVVNPVSGRCGHPTPVGMTGWIDTSRYDVIVADAQTDIAVPDGEVGEILIRPKIPYTMTAGYYRMPEKTVAAWRNGWFHTGDAGIIANGALTYVDRMDDCIRRRGQNISPTEVEMTLAGLPDIAEVSAYGIRPGTADTEMEVALAVVLAQGSTATAQQIGEMAQAALPRFARPRYIRIMDALPKTPTAKVQRAALRKHGLQGVYDRGQS